MQAPFQHETRDFLVQVFRCSGRQYIAAQNWTITVFVAAVTARYALLANVVAALIALDSVAFRAKFTLTNVTSTATSIFVVEKLITLAA